MTDECRISCRSWERRRRRRPTHAAGEFRMELTGRPVELLIFDWDGTLADSAAMIVNAMQSAIRGLGLPPRLDVQIRELIGLGLNEGLQSSYPEMDIPELRRLLDSYRTQWLSEGGGEAPLFAGARGDTGPAWAGLHRIAVATGEIRRGLDRVGLGTMPNCAGWSASAARRRDGVQAQSLMLSEILRKRPCPPIQP